MNVKKKIVVENLLLQSDSFMSNLGKKAIYKPENLSLELQKFANSSIC